MAKPPKKQSRKKISKNFPSVKNRTVTNVQESISEVNDTISNFFKLCTKFEWHVAEYRSTWKVILQECLVFYKIDISTRPTIVISIKIDKNLKVHAFTDRGEAKAQHLEFLLNKQHILQYWSQLKNLLLYFGNENIISKINVKNNLTQASMCLKECLEHNSLANDSSGLKSKLEFIFSQIHALTDSKFTDDIICLAYLIYLKSSSCYSYLENLDGITLPTTEDLIKYMHKDDQQIVEKAWN